MRLIQVFVVLILCGQFPLYAQYTETINSNRPGDSQGAFAVGRGVLQLETAPYFGNDKHALFKTDTDLLGGNYALRYGLLTENLEINVIGSFLSEITTINIARNDEEFKRSNFKSNTIGAKYLFYDPYKNAEEDKPNLYSWKANQRFKWKKLIPAISLFAGANFNFGENPFMYEDEADFTPKLVLSTQNNWGRWVLVMNFVADKFTEEYPSYAGIATMTHAFTPKFAGFAEYQAIIGDLYADDIIRGGAAYLLTDNLQVDVSGLVNFKDTPSRWQVSAGLSFRIDMHKEDEFLDDSYEGDRRRARSEKEESESGDPENE